MPDGPGKRYPLSSRLTFETHNALKEAAKLSGRSIAQEVEFRLEQSFVSEHHEADIRRNLVAQAIEGDEDTATLIRTITAAIGAVCAYTEKKWQTDTYTRYGVVAAAQSAIVETFNRKEIPETARESEIDEAWLSKVQSTGQFMGRMLANPRSPEFLEWVSSMSEVRRGDGA
ncbi:TraY domain-containing protein [Methylobacterium sp. CM6247]